VEKSDDPYNPWQVVWFHSAYHLDPGQQPFSYQKNIMVYLWFIDSTKHYDFIVTEGRDKCHIIEHFKKPDGSEDAEAAKDAGYELLNIKGLDLLGELAPYDTDGYRVRGGFQKYTLYYDSVGTVTFTINETGSSEIYYFHTIIVKPDSYTLSESLSSEIPHGEQENIYLAANRDQCPSWDEIYNGGGYYGAYNYEIVQGSNYATLIKEHFDEENFANIRETGTSFTNTNDPVYLWMNGAEPDSFATVTIRFSATESNINPLEKVVKIVKNDNYPIQVTVEPAELNPGDTANVILKQKTSEYGMDPVTYDDFPSGQLFDVSITKGAEYADIYLPGDGRSGDSFTQIEEGFKLKINDNIDTSYAEIHLRVDTKIIENQFQSADVNNNTGKQKANGKKVTSGARKKKKNKYSLTFIGVPTGKEIFGIGKAAVGKQIVVQFEPAELSPGDTALVKIYKKDIDGNLVEFPAGQKYEIGIMEGCEYGDLLVNDTLDVYFTDVTAPIKYVAADSVGTDSAKVSLRVGIIPAAGTSVKQKSKNKKANGITASYCSINAFVYDEYGTGSVDIKSGCEDYFCMEEKKFPDFNLDIKPNGYSGIDGCSNREPLPAGIFMPITSYFDENNNRKFVDDLLKTLLVPFKLHNGCYDAKDKTWKFSIISQGEESTIYSRWDAFYLKAIKSICMDNIKSDEKTIVIKNNSESLNDEREIHLDNIPENEVCKTLQDFEYNRPYRDDPQYSTEFNQYMQYESKFYFILDVVKAHEDVHQKDFERLVNKMLDQEINGRTTRAFLLNPKIKCEDALTEEKARKKAENLYKSKMRDFLDLVKNTFEKEKKLRNEIKVQKNEDVQRVIDQYRDYLKHKFEKQCSIREIDYTNNEGDK